MWFDFQGGLNIFQSIFFIDGTGEEGGGLGCSWQQNKIKAHLPPSVNDF